MWLKLEKKTFSTQFGGPFCATARSAYFHPAIASLSQLLGKTNWKVPQLRKGSKSQISTRTKEIAEKQWALRSAVFFLAALFMRIAIGDFGVFKFALNFFFSFPFFFFWAWNIWARWPCWGAWQRFQDSRRRFLARRSATKRGHGTWKSHFLKRRSAFEVSVKRQGKTRGHDFNTRVS